MGRGGGRAQYRRVQGSVNLLASFSIWRSAVQSVLPPRVYGGDTPAARGVIFLQAQHVLKPL